MTCAGRRDWASFYIWLGLGLFCGAFWVVVGILVGALIATL